MSIRSLLVIELRRDEVEIIVQFFDRRRSHRSPGSHSPPSRKARRPGDPLLAGLPIMSCTTFLGELIGQNNTSSLQVQSIVILVIFDTAVVGNVHLLESQSPDF